MPTNQLRQRGKALMARVRRLLTRAAQIVLLNEHQPRPIACWSGLRGDQLRREYVVIGSKLVLEPLWHIVGRRVSGAGATAFTARTIPQLAPHRGTPLAKMTACHRSASAQNLAPPCFGWFWLG